MQHALIINHQGINHEIVLKVLNMILPYRQAFIKRDEPVKHNLGIYRYGDDRTVISHNDDLQVVVDGLEGALKESGMETTRVQIDSEIDPYDYICEYLKGENKAQVVEELQLLDLDEYK